MKALATSQIILLVIGIIVLAIIGYLVYTQFIVGSTQFGQTNCQSALVSVCNSCKTCVVGTGNTWLAGCPPSQCTSLCTVTSGCDTYATSIGAGYCNTIHVVGPDNCAKLGIS